MSKAILLDRLISANPGWDDWQALVALVEAMEFQTIECDYPPDDPFVFYIGDSSPLTFSKFSDKTRQSWPTWLPAYVPALYGMQYGDYETAGGYALECDGTRGKNGAVFSPAGNDSALGFPLFDVPNDVYYFQTNASGALFHVDRKLDILYPNSDAARMEVLDTLEGFTKTNIRQALAGCDWFDAYRDSIKGTLID